MKKLTLAFTLCPGVVLAHGGHAPLPEAAHSVSHAGPVLGALVIAATLALVLHNRWRS